MNNLFSEGASTGNAQQNQQGQQSGLFGELKRVPVVLPVALNMTYDYVLPEGMSAPAGSFVVVPFGPQERIGVVWNAPVAATEVNPAKLKAVIDVINLPPLPDATLKFAQWLANYTLNPLGMVVRMLMAAPRAFEAEKPRFGVRMDGPPPPRVSPGRQRVLDIAADGLIRAKPHLAEEAGVSPAIVNGLVKTGTLVNVELPPERLRAPDPHHNAPELNDEQNEAAHALRSAVDARNFSVSLLDGITGSGKTETYFEGIARALAQEDTAQVCVLLPEIALTTEFLSRFEQRFGCRPVEWHSSLSPVDRAKVWKAAATGEAKAVIGARSALFLPYQNLKLIVVDEEHDAGFKQEDRVNYQARDMAVVRASIGKIPIVLASATPSIESVHNVAQGRYRHLKLRTRFSGRELPEITPIDMRLDPPERGNWLSPVLADAVSETLAKGEQSLLFLNRRGYAPLTLCRKCGHRFECPQCSAWLVEHRFRKKLTCHHCGFTTPPPPTCPKCREEDSLVACGPGVERVAEEVRERFPDARLSILSSDLISSIHDLRAILHEITSGETDIIIGTQIVAKGHNFPGLALVGVVDGDMGLGGADPRAAERTFQLLYQVTGRAGRAAIEGRGLIQTHMPEHPVMSAIVSGDRDQFLAHELQNRQTAMMPPYGRLAAMIFSSREKPMAEEFARMVVNHAPPATNIHVLGPVEAPLAVIRGRYRFRALVRATKDEDIQAYLRLWIDRLPKIKGDLRLSVDVDPYSFL